MPKPEVREAAVQPPATSARDLFDVYRTDALSFLAAGIAHDLANPLGAMLAFASYLASDPRLPADLRDDARLLRVEAARTHRMVRTLLEFARNRPPSTSAVAVGRVVSEVLELEAYLLAEVSVEVDIPEDLPAVTTDASRLRHLILVLSVEAIRRLGERPARGRLDISADVVPDRTRVRLAMAFELDPDDGPVADNRPARFDADALAAVAALVQELGGDLRIEPAAAGSRFVLELPIAAEVTQDPATAGDPGRLPAPSSGRPATPVDARPVVLVCDDEPAIRTLVARLLGRARFRTLEAADASEALRLLDTNDVDVVLTDHHMREMSGIELYERAIEKRMPLSPRFVLMSGDPGGEELVQFASEHHITILAKPFDLKTITAIIDDVARH